MLIQVLHLPPGTTVEDIKDLFCRMHIIDSIHVSDTTNLDESVAWVGLRCSRTGANAISKRLNGRYFKGQHVSTYTALFLH